GETGVSGVAAVAALLSLAQEPFAQTAQALGQRLGARQTAGQPNGELVGFQVGDARRATAQVLLDALPALRREFAGHEVDEELGQFTAGHHAGTSSKWGARASRISSRPRCSRLLTAGTLRPSMSAVSAFGKPSTSARTYTSR